MINRNLKQYEIKKPVKTTDKYNQTIVEYEDAGLARVSISLNGRSNEVEYNTWVTQCEWVGFTDNRDIQIGWKVGELEVKFITETRRWRILYLKEYEHGV